MREFSSNKARGQFNSFARDRVIRGSRSLDHSLERDALEQHLHGNQSEANSTFQKVSPHERPNWIYSENKPIESPANIMSETQFLNLNENGIRSNISPFQQTLRKNNYLSNKHTAAKIGLSENNSYKSNQTINYVSTPIKKCINCQMKNRNISKLQSEVDQKDKIIQSLTISIESLSLGKAHKSYEKVNQLKQKYEQTKKHIREMEQDMAKKDEIIQKYREIKTQMKFDIKEIVNKYNESVDN